MGRVRSQSDGIVVVSLLIAGGGKDRFAPVLKPSVNLLVVFVGDQRKRIIVDPNFRLEVQPQRRSDDPVHTGDSGIERVRLGIYSVSERRRRIGLGLNRFYAAVRIVITGEEIEFLRHVIVRVGRVSHQRDAQILKVQRGGCQRSQVKLLVIGIAYDTVIVYRSVIGNGQLIGWEVSSC